METEETWMAGSSPAKGFIGFKRGADKGFALAERAMAGRQTRVA